MCHNLLACQNVATCLQSHGLSIRMKKSQAYVSVLVLDCLEVIMMQVLGLCKDGESTFFWLVYQLQVNEKLTINLTCFIFLELVHGSLN